MIPLLPQISKICVSEMAPIIIASRLMVNVYQNPQGPMTPPGGVPTGSEPGGYIRVKQQLKNKYIRTLIQSESEQVKRYNQKCWRRNRLRYPLFFKHVIYKIYIFLKYRRYFGVFREYFCNGTIVPFLLCIPTFKSRPDFIPIFIQV